MMSRAHDPEPGHSSVAPESQLTDLRLPPPQPMPPPRDQMHAGEEPAAGEPHKDVAVAPKTEYVTAQTTPPAIEAWKRVGVAGIIALAFAIDHVLEARQLHFTWEQAITGGFRNWFEQMRPTLIAFGGIYAAIDQFARAKKV